MASPLQNYSLGKFGVNVDKSDIELAEGELREAQNAVSDPLGFEGGITKRPGLLPITSDLGNAVLGGIGVPFALRVSTINGTTLSADPGPGGTPGTPPTTGGTPPPGGSGGSGGSGGGSTGLPVETVRWYRRQSTDGTVGATGLSYGFWKSVDSFASSTEIAKGTLVENGIFTTVLNATRTKVIGNDAVTYSPGMIFSNSQYEGILSVGAPNSVAVIDNKIYFSPEIYAVPAITGNSAGQLWVLDPADPTAIFGRKILTIPTVAGQDSAILSMIAHGTTIYFTTVEGSTGASGRVLYYNTADGAYGELGAGTFSATTGCPVCLCWHSGQLFVGTKIRASDAPALIYVCDPPQTKAEEDAQQDTPVVWTLDKTLTAGTGYVAVLTLCSFNGVLYAGGSSTGAVDNLVLRRDALGAWTTSLTIANGGVSRFVAGAIVFQNALYLAANTSTIGTAPTIRKFDGTTWTVAYTHSVPNSWLLIPWVSNGILFYGGGGNASEVQLVSSVDGTTWVVKTANLADTTGLVLAGGGVAVYQVYP